MSTTEYTMIKLEFDNLDDESDNKKSRIVLSLDANKEVLFYTFKIHY